MTWAILPSGPMTMTARLPAMPVSRGLPPNAAKTRLPGSLPNRNGNCPSAAQERSSSVGSALMAIRTTSRPPWKSSAY
jgi:hypothetical protein